MFCATLCLAQKEVAGVKFPDFYQWKNHKLYLNGAGLREKWWIDLYVAGFYVEKRSQDAKELIEKDQAALMRIVIVSSLVTTDRMKEAIQEGFEKSTKFYPTSKEKIQHFIKLFNTELKKGDVVELLYLPKEGTYVYINRKYKGHLKGEDFKKALWAIWLGPDPVDDDLKNELLKL